jgi:hypothetical protein
MNDTFLSAHVTYMHEWHFIILFNVNKSKELINCG